MITSICEFAGSMWNLNFVSGPECLKISRTIFDECHQNIIFCRQLIG